MLDGALRTRHAEMRRTVFIWVVGIRGRCAGLKNQITSFDSKTTHHPYEIVLANYEIAGVEQYDF